METVTLKLLLESSRIMHARDVPRFWNSCRTFFLLSKSSPLHRRKVPSGWGSSPKSECLGHSTEE
ncbi:hypothetical protein ACI1P2_22750 [Paenibacillus sp. p-8]